ncbi:MAG: phosphoribosylformylglycinamidine synthase [Clostridiales Family XIII bacterium]|jgi:phosphoribosylformylglycinamidine synthase|nr:phosphoribosylformylglycinamidine synthase [Clostridiales Family XIII bacterium]
MVKRIFVEKKMGFDIEAQKLKKEFKENLGISGTGRVRVINRYDIENIPNELFQRARKEVFSEPNLDNISDESVEIPKVAFYFGVEYLPGQFDQRADSAQTCIRLIDPGSSPIVKCARFIVIESELSEEAQGSIIKYCVNPVDSRLASNRKPETLTEKIPEPAAVKVVNGFREFSESDLRKFASAQGFAMSFDDLCFVKNFFSEEEFRDPTITELKVIDTYWSDHCRHTTFNTRLTNITFEEGKYAGVVEEAYEEYLAMRKKVYGRNAEKRHITLMDMATIATKYMKKEGALQDLDESDEINACSFKVEANITKRPGRKASKEDWLVMFKNETHNHPTEIEPFGGAATCLGGAIRDPLSGRAFVYQAMRVTGSGDPTDSIRDTLRGKLTQYQITRGAAKGYSSYGNQIGLATGFVDEIYEENYVAKRLEIGAVIGAAPAENVIREKPVKGDVILAVGGRTGRDGIGGATGSSKEHKKETIYKAGAEVQKGNPPVERDIQRLFRRSEVAKLIKRCNDFGAGGVSVAIGELAPSVDVDLDKLPKKYEGLDGTELAISESQERMAVVVAREDAERFIKYANEENVEATVVARVTDTGRFRMYWRDDTILDIPRRFIDTNGVDQERSVVVRDEAIRVGRGENAPEALRLKEKDLIKLLTDLNCGSKRGLIEYFDSTIGARSVMMPLGGKNQLTPAIGMIARLPVLEGDTDTATVMAYGFDPYVSSGSPFHGAVYAVVDSLTKIAALGGDHEKAKLSFQEYFPKLGKVPQRWGSPTMALLGALKAQKELGVPAIGGKDSMSGTFHHIDVPPTLVSFAVGVMDAGKAVSQELKRADSKLVFIESRRDENGLPDWGQLRANLRRVRELTAKHKILSANTIARGGIFVSLAKMAVGNDIGVSFTAPNTTDLTEESYGSLILEISGKDKPENLFRGLDYFDMGRTTAGSEIEIKGIRGEEDQFEKYPVKIPLGEIKDKWEAPLASVFPVAAGMRSGSERIPGLLYEKRSSAAPKVSIGGKKPKVFIPVFPGTNCEMDSKRAFERAGADVKTIFLLDRDPATLPAVIREMADEIRKSQIVMIPGGFSGGDEPEGSAKYITSVFRSGYIAEAVTELIDKRGGLMLGVCNGFQALIKLGLLPYGRITETGESAPTLTYNTIGRHQSKIVRTRVSSVLSPWFAGLEAGDIVSVPISHGEGRFVANEETLSALEKKGQIATQYVDLDGEPTYDTGFNPNGSAMAIEGLTSPDGRILGKMGHTERNVAGLYVNVPGRYDDSLFKAGVQYFK